MEAQTLPMQEVCRDLGVVVGRRWSVVGGRSSVEGWRPVRVQCVVHAGCQVDQGASGRCRVAVTSQDLTDIEDEREGEPVVAFGEPRVVAGGVVVHSVTIHPLGAVANARAQVVDSCLAAVRVRCRCRGPSGVYG